MSLFGTDRDVDQIAEYADATVRQMSRRGSLAPIAGRTGFNAWLYDKWGNRGNAVYTFLGGLLTIAFSGVLAWALDEPLVFPSLGATAFLFFETPMAEVASPRNAIMGHLFAIVAAMAAIAAFGLLGAPSVYEAGMEPARIGAVAFAVGLTGGGLRLLRAAHPPAGATTIIVASGLLDQASQLVDVAVGVLIVTVAGFCLNRAMGVPAPVWRALG